MSDTAIKVWISKCALSRGIHEIETTEPRNNLEIVRDGWDYCHGDGREWHRTRAGAIAKAEEMRLAKIASLKKQIAKLEKLKFD